MYDHRRANNTLIYIYIFIFLQIMSCTAVRKRKYFEPRFISDFGSSKHRRKNVDLVKKILIHPTKKILALQKKNSWLIMRIQCLKELVWHLKPISKDAAEYLSIIISLVYFNPTFRSNI